MIQGKFKNIYQEVKVFMEIGDNFNMLEYLKSIKELWEAKSVYEQTVSSLINRYNNLGRQKK